MNGMSAVLTKKKKKKKLECHVLIFLGFDRIYNKSSNTTPLF